MLDPGMQGLLGTVGCCRDACYTVPAISGYDDQDYADTKCSAILVMYI